jgi:hypothetical protein
MDILALIQSFFERARKRDPQLPGWRQPETRQKKSRTPFASQRKRGPGRQNMTIEEFADKDARNLRFQEWKAKGAPDVTRFSTVRGNKSVWCVARGWR